VEQVELKAKKRDVTAEKPNHVRQEGMIPAVLYGRDEDTVHIKLDEKEFSRIVAEYGGRTAVLNVKVGRERKTRPVIIKEVQRDPVRGSILHTDLYQVSLKQKIQARVPLVVTGEEEARSSGGIVQHLLREIEVECLPTAIPESIVVDISSLTVGDNVTVDQLDIPEGAELVTSPEEIVVTVVAPRLVIEEEEAEDEELEAAEGEEAAEEGGAEEGAAATEEQEA